MPNRGERHEAKQRGEKHYAGGKPCPTCGAGVRYVKNGDCVPCAQRRRRERDAAKSPDTRRAERKRWWHNTPPHIRREQKARSNRKMLYGCTPEHFKMLGDQQGWVCGVCADNIGENHAMVDHDHATGKIRGLLCRHCNWALGHLKDDPARAEGAAAYLRRTK